MQDTRLEETIDIFRQLSPSNQLRFISMVRVAEAAEQNVKKTLDKYKDSEETKESGL